MGLLSVKDRLVSEASTLQKRKLALAVACIGAPSYILVEDLTRDLSPEGARSINISIGRAA